MFERIREIIVEQLGVDEEAVTPNASFEKDLSADSLDLFEMVMGLEDEFDIKIAVVNLEKIKTVEDIVNYINENK